MTNTQSEGLQAADLGVVCVVPWRALLDGFSEWIAFMQILLQTDDFLCLEGIVNPIRGWLMNDSIKI